MLRYAVAGAVSAALGLMDLPASQLAGLASWSRRTFAWIAPLYLVLSAAGGVAAIALASSVGAPSADGQPTVAAAALLGAAGHAAMRASLRARPGRSDATVAASVLERAREWLEALLRAKAAAQILPAIKALSDDGLLELAADLAEPALENPSKARRQRLDILLAAAEAFHGARGRSKDQGRRSLRTALRAEVVHQGATRKRVRQADESGGPAPAKRRLSHRKNG
jgi:hypothetical protein